MAARSLPKPGRILLQSLSYRSEAVLCRGTKSGFHERQRRPRKQCPNIDALTSWIAGGKTGDHGVRSDNARGVDIQYQDDGQGWGLVVTEDVKEGCVLVDVPMEYTIQGCESDEEMVPWNVQMVSVLLEHAASAGWEDWIGGMPVHVDLPWIYWEEEEIAALEDKDAIYEIHKLREFLHGQSASLREYIGAYTWADILWAFSMVHSRSFLYGNQHMFVPIVDMANHDTTGYNAHVGVKYSPSTCQGRDALEEIAPVDENATEESSMFQLVASRDIDAGEQITISYGSLCNDVLLLYFGFALSENENDQVILFQDTDEAVAEICSLLGIPLDVIEMDSLQHERRYFVMKHGADPRLLQLISSIIECCGMADKHSVTEVLHSICSQRLKAFSTTLEEDRQMLRSLQSKHTREMSALSFRYNKKNILDHVLVACI